MDIEELGILLKKERIKESTYSLDEGLKPDARILFYNNKQWEVFYLDERGGRNDIKIFDSESQACLCIYEQLKEDKRIADKFNLNY